VTRAAVGAPYSWGLAVRGDRANRVRLAIAERREVAESVIGELQSGLRSGDLWVPGSRRYTDPSTLLLPPDRWAGQRDDFCTVTGTDPRFET
jgi:hypothetical protein